MTIPFLACIASVAAFYHLPPRVLPFIQAVEGGRPGLVHFNQNNTQDLGVSQVNTSWVQPRAWQIGMSPAQAKQRLLFDPYFNIAVAVGYYHSHWSPLADAYRLQVASSATRLFGGNRTR